MGKTIGSDRRKRPGQATNKKVGYDDLTKEAAKALVPVEDVIVYQSVETLYAVNDAGKELINVRGDERSVPLPEEFYFSRTFFNSIMTHNHPTTNSNSFSLADIQLALVYGVKEMRVVTRDQNNKKILFRMRFPPEVDLNRYHYDFFQGFSEDTPFKFFRGAYHTREGQMWFRERLSKAYSRINADVKREFLDRIDTGRMTIKEAEGKHFDEVWRRFTERTNIKYEKTYL